MADDINKGGVGKGRPPTANRFKPGKSGNPCGRKKGHANLKTIVNKVAHEEHVVTEGGALVRRSTVDLIFLCLQRRALSSDLEAKKLLDGLRARYEPEDLPSRSPGIIIPPTLSMEDWMIVAEAERARMLWMQANREKIWEEMGLTG